MNNCAQLVSSVALVPREESSRKNYPLSRRITDPINSPNFTLRDRVRADKSRALGSGSARG